MGIKTNGGVKTANNLNIMKTIKRVIREFKEKRNLIPFKTIILDTGVICQHYRNGKIEVK
jgi:hypothetical protein